MDKNTKTVLTVLIASAAIAGLVYYLNDNDEAKSAWRKAQGKASGAWDKLKGTFYTAKGEATNKMSDAV